MHPDDETAVTAILFAAGYRGDKLSDEVKRRAQIDDDAGCSSGGGRVTKLDLTCCEFRSLPSEIGKLSSLTVLDLTYCKRLVTLPREVGMLSHLTRLDLYCCSRLEKIPAELGRVHTLSQLELFGCDALTVPPAKSRSVGEAIPFLRSLLRLLEDPVGSVSELRADPFLLCAAAKDAAFATSLRTVLNVDRSLADIIVVVDRKQTVLDVACAECRGEMEEALFFFKRYEMEYCPAYEGATSVVYFAVDHRPDGGGGGEQRPVTLKFIYDKKRLQAERDVRAYRQENPRFTAHYVIGALHDHDGDADTEFRSAAKRRRLPAYCLVMERGGRNLLDAIHNEYLSGHMDKVRVILEELAKALSYVHHTGYVLGNFKPRNIVRSTSTGDGGGKWKLIDFASAVPKGDAMPRAGWLAYMPPEMVSKTGCTTNGQGGRAELRATESIDAWSFGAVMFRLIAGASLIEGTDDHDKLREGGRLTLRGWNDEVLRDKLSIVTDQAARDLLTQLLQRDPDNRPSMEDVLRHDFFASMHLPQ